MDSNAIRIYVVEDDPVFARTLQKALEEADSRYDISLYTNGTKFLQDLAMNPDIVTLDYHLPDYDGISLLQKTKAFNSDINTIILSGQEKADVVVDALSAGADHYVIKNDKAIMEVVKSVKNFSKSVALRQEVDHLKDQLIDRSKYENILGESKSILKVLNLIQKVEQNDILVMITGESGTGKDVVAQTLHYNSPRKRKRFVAVNVAAIPQDLIESELFGHEKGAFTGAVSKRIGKFEEANGGTIFLDEIAEMELGIQSKLLRILQDQKVSRLGSNKEIQLNVRVLVATNQDLMKMVQAGKFREDLYYRLQGFRIHLPPLRDRENDVIILARHFLKDFCQNNNLAEITLEKNAMAKLMHHEWPGNVRELKAVIERAALISSGGSIKEDDILF